jgi:hypothetical protein
MFRFTRKSSSRSHSQYLAKNYILGSMWIRGSRTDIFSVMAAYYDL